MHPDLLPPTEPRYADATAAYNLFATPTPDFAVIARDREAVVSAAAAARKRGLGVRVASTGHAADAAGPWDGQVLIRTAIDEPVRIDPERRTATFPAGTTWDAVVRAAAPHGLAALHGSSGDVGAVGYLLGGGMSFYGRRYGVAANAVTRITLLTAEGAIRSVDAYHDPELFWALRGGGGGFGVVLEVETRLVPVERVFTGAIFWPGELATDLLDRYDRWAGVAPREASTSFRIMHLPRTPRLPETVTSGAVVVVDGAVLDGGERSGSEIARDLLGPLGSVGPPLLDTWRAGTPLDTPTAHMDPPDPMPYVADHLVLSALPSAAQQRLVALATEPGAESLTFVGLRQLGGAFADRDPAGGAVDHFDGDYAMNATGTVRGPESADAVRDRLARVRGGLAPWDEGTTIPTIVASFTAPQRSFDPSVARAVDAVRRRVDPDGLFRGDVSAAARATD